MKLKNAIDTAVSHNALVVLEETDPKDSLYCINGITPERVIRTAFKWCLDKGLITNPIYIK